MYTETPETEELIERARRGDDPARQALLARHRTRLRRMVAARVDPSDVVQEVLVEAHRTLGTYLQDRALPFYPWLQRLAWERLAKLYRRHVRSGKRSLLREGAEGPGLPDESAMARSG
jgi:RNA polymerase sigma-70 factor (ECF subfamily)